ncbi:hypothetical protein P691DRAFT_851402, partial [Macrolepiota fuliginosa MF-IS2]
VLFQRGSSRFARKVDSTKSALPADHIQTYLKEPIIPTNVIQDAGGYMKWWHTAANNQPTVAKVALDYCSAPGVFQFLCNEFNA